MKVSVVIPTYNRDKLLAETLTSLVNQTFDRDDYEILVVDNASTDGTKDVVAKFSDETDGLVKYLYEPRPGAHFARNGAVKHAMGELLYFTDDDVMAERDMLENLVKVMEMDSNIASATGPVRAKWLSPPPHWILRLCNNYLLSLNELPDESLVSDSDPGIFSCHQIVQKDVFIKAGGYNPDIVNGEWLGDNETGLNIKIQKLGYKFAYTAKALIYHQIPAARMTQKYLNRRLANQGNCDSCTDYRRFNFPACELRRQNAHFIKKYFKRQFLSLKLRLTGNERWHLVRAECYYYSNRIRYNNKLIHSAQWRDMVLTNNWIS